VKAEYYRKRAKGGKVGLLGIHFKESRHDHAGYPTERRSNKYIEGL